MRLDPPLPSAAAYVAGTSFDTLVNFFKIFRIKNNPSPRWIALSLLRILLPVLVYHCIDIVNGASRLFLDVSKVFASSFVPFFVQGVLSLKL